MERKRNPGAVAAAPGARTSSQSATSTRTDAAKQDRRPIFTIRLRPEPGTDGYRALRGLLKRALRGYGLRCIFCIEEPRDKVVTAPFTRIVRDRDDGWLVVNHRGHGWLHGDRPSALEEKRWHDAQWRGRR
jgi:hypothetical protein